MGLYSVGLLSKGYLRLRFGGLIFGGEGLINGILWYVNTKRKSWQKLTHKEA